MVPFRQNIFGRRQKLFNRGTHTPFQKHRLTDSSHLAQQVKILHVAGANLQQIGIFGNQSDIIRAHDFGHNRQAALFAAIASSLSPSSRNP